MLVENWMYFAAASLVVAFMYKYKNEFMCVSHDLKNKVETFTPGRPKPTKNVYHSVLDSILTNAVKTKRYLSTPRVSPSDTFSTDLSPSSWTVRPLSPANSFAPRDPEKPVYFLELLEKQGEGAPIIWRVGQKIRWSGKDPYNRSVIDGDYTITKVDLEGEMRRLYLDAMEPLNGYWGTPEIFVVGDSSL